MATCPRYITPITNSENVGDSLIKINNNFWNLKEALCGIVKTLDDTVRVRTFFYYGPNSPNDPNSMAVLMREGQASRPANITIETFINTELNLPSISDVNDVAYVIYQKTGFLMQQAIRTTSGTVPVPGTSAGGAVTTNTNVPIYNPPLTKNVPWSTTTPDRYGIFSPAFIIWRLTYKFGLYFTDPGFPKFSQAETASTPNWNNPLAWSAY
jgi:hypothetical protein